MYYMYSCNLYHKDNVGYRMFQLLPLKLFILSSSQFPTPKGNNDFDFCHHNLD